MAPGRRSKSFRPAGAGNPTAPPAPEACADYQWTIGTVAAPFGLKGDLKVNYETDFPERFARLRVVCLRSPAGDARLFDVERTRPHKGRELLKLAGLDRIEDAEPWRGARVQIPRAEAVPLPDNSYYRSDLEGLEVVTREGARLGKLETVLPYPGNHLLKIGEILIPAIKEFVLEVDIPGGRIVVAPPEGLLPGTEHAD